MAHSVYIYIYIYIYMCVCVCVCVYIYIYINRLTIWEKHCLKVAMRVFNFLTTTIHLIRLVCCVSNFRFNRYIRLVYYSRLKSVKFDANVRYE